MRKRKSSAGCIVFIILILLTVYAACKIPVFLGNERERLSVRWENGYKAWENKNYAEAEKNWDVLPLRLYEVRRPAKFLYWRAKALEKMGKNKKAESVRSNLLEKYPLDYYAFRLRPDKGGVNTKNKKELLSDVKDKFKTLYEDEVNFAAQKSGVEKELIWAVMKRESKFNPLAVSSSGAEGLMQLMPETAKEIARKNGINRFYMLHPMDNILIGSLMIGKMLKRCNGNVLRASAAYNAGLANVNSWKKYREDEDMWVENIPYLETREFVRCVYENYSIYKLLLRVE